jgi:putative ABC transport system permease protein
MTYLWISGLFRKRFGRLAGALAGVALTVALLATLAFFLVDSSVSMTKRAVEAVPIDWQVEAVPAADATAIRDAIGKAATVTAIHEVRYAQASGFEATTGGTVQTTGPGKVIAFDSGYLRDFPKEIRPLAGTFDGALIAQQTAANLHVGPGDTVVVKRVGLGPETIKISGVVDLPDADSLFQAVGLPAQAAPQAPPDNVLILPLADWHRLFDPQQAAKPDSTRLQFHARLAREVLPARPGDAYTMVAGAAKNLEIQVAGQALVANNLGARLDAVKGDALYATILFLFLGIPGVGLASVLTLAVASTGSGRRAIEQALLRVRGASTKRILSLSGSEAALVGAAGVALGLLAALSFGGLTLGTGSALSAVAWSSLFVTLIGMLLAVVAILGPAWTTSRMRTVVSARRAVGRESVPVWQKYWLDVLSLVLAALVFWQSASTGYQIVLAPEGVPATAVDYKAFIAPALFWIGSALLTVRVCSTIIAANGRMLRVAIRPLARRLSPVVAASLSRQPRRITLAIAMTALAISFATSTAIFNTTYNNQARVDAELTNGADVTVFGTTARPASAHLSAISTLPGVRVVEPMQHRFAYVGADLQDMYGIDPKTIGDATSLSDSYFRGGTASEILTKLANTPDGVLVSEETVKDFQLQQGDTINLRLVDARDNQYHAIPFKFIGVAREFPTAPRDSFLVANSAYIAKMTGTNIAEYALMRATGDPAQLAKTVKAALAGEPSLQVRDVGTASHIIGSSLTAVDLSSLTRIELAFAVVMAAASAGLMLALGFIDRRRNFAILTAIGAKRDQIGSFLWAEGSLVALGGTIFGLLSGTVTAWMLVKLLTGVFDPAPDALSIPWFYIAAVVAMVVASIAAAVYVTNIRSGRATAESLRDL